MTGNINNETSSKMVGDPLRNLITIIMRGSLDRNFHLEIDMLMRSKHSISNWKPMMYLCKPFSYATHWGKSLGLVKKSTSTWKFKFNWWKVKKKILLQSLRDRFFKIHLHLFFFNIPSWQKRGTKINISKSNWDFDVRGPKDFFLLNSVLK